LLREFSFVKKTLSDPGQPVNDGAFMAISFVGCLKVMEKPFELQLAIVFAGKHC
jgi:hypothetical protein